MILITGGSFQGKKTFAEQYIEKEKIGVPISVVWTDGGEASWKEFVEGRYCCCLHLFVRRVLDGSVGPADGDGGPDGDNQADKKEPILRLLLEEMLSGPSDRVIVTDEIGCGIVPADASGRLYREETGRLCCLIAAGAGEVWRVCCGMGMRIK